jgi:hypothetical protein
MSEHGGPGRAPDDQPTRRWDGDADPTRRTAARPEAAAAAEWTRPWVVAAPLPPPPGPAPTRPLPSDPSQAASSEPSATASLDPTRALEEPWEGTAHPVTTGSHATDADPTFDDRQLPAAEAAADGRGRRRGRDVTLLLVGSVLGFVLAFLIVAWSTSGEPATDDEAAAAQQAEIAALEEQVGALEAERDEANARTDAREAQLAEAEAAAGARDEDVEAQRQALDERADALDGRASALDAREDQLDEREGALDDRSAALDAREQELDARESALDAGEVPAEGGGTGDGDGEDDGGIQLPQLPDIDTDEVGNVVERALDWLRDLF